MLWSPFQLGVGRDQLLSAEGVLANSSKDQYIVCTDDVLNFRRASCAEAAATVVLPLCSLDEAWANLGIEGNAKKTFDVILNCTALGIEVCDGST
jgi:hypothetical protein